MLSFPVLAAVKYSENSTISAMQSLCRDVEWRRRSKNWQTKRPSKRVLPPT